MAEEPLLDQQRRLVEYLTDPSRWEGRAPAGLDRRRMQFVGELGLCKRMDKIRSVLPRTFAEMGEPLRSMVVAFAVGFPPDRIGALANAEQFVEFALRLWRKNPPFPRFLGDLARFEIAIRRLGTAEPLARDSENQDTDPAPTGA